MTQIKIHLFFALKTLELICCWLIGLIKSIIEPIIGVNIRKVLFVILILNAPETGLRKKINGFNHTVDCN